MSRARRQPRTEMGEAISFEEVLTVITVLLLLRLVFMVPLVNLDKAKTIAARGDAYWSQQANYVLSHSGDSVKTKPYKIAFALEGQKVMATESGMGKNLYLEGATADSNVIVIQHDQSTDRFIAMSVQGRGHSRSFRRGHLIWSQDEHEWFPASDSVDYGSREDSKMMETKFREWTKSHRGY